MHLTQLLSSSNHNTPLLHLNLNVRVDLKSSFGEPFTFKQNLGDGGLLPERLTGLVVIPSAFNLVNALNVLGISDVSRMLTSESSLAAKGLPDDALVVRGGANITPDSIVKGTGTHPSGTAGFSVESKAGACLGDL